MKLGFFTAALPNQTLEQVAQWGAESGFQAIEIACWPQEKVARRYAGEPQAPLTRYGSTTVAEPRPNEYRSTLHGPPGVPNTVTSKRLTLEPSTAENTA